MPVLNWNSTREDAQLINRIARRASKIAGEHGGEYPIMEAEMDVTALHLNKCPLRLADLLAADDMNFAHDVLGIRRHIDRETGKLGNCFLPRYAA